MKSLKIIFSLCFILLQIFTFAQKKTYKKGSQVIEKPPIIKPLVTVQDGRSNINPILKILMKSEDMRTFSWEMDSDTLLAKNSVIKEIMKFYCYEYSCSKGDLITNSTAEDSTFRKKSESKKGEDNIVHSFVQRKNSFTFKIDKDILSIIDEKKNLITLKVFLDKSRRNIKMLQNIKTKRKYYPSEPYYAPPSM